MSKPFIILDRDGVINFDSDDYIKTLEEWRPLPGSIDAIANLSKGGFSVVIATNQSGLGRGYLDEFTLANMHELMSQLVEEKGGEITGLFFCPHLPEANCTCRKPLPGLLEQIELEFSISVAGSWFVGDSEKDIDVALAKQCLPMLVKTGKGRSTLAKLSKDKLERTLVFDDLFAVSQYVLSHTNNIFKTE